MAFCKAADIEKAAAAADEGAATLALCEAKRRRRSFRRLPHCYKADFAAFVRTPPEGQLLPRSPSSAFAAAFSIFAISPTPTNAAILTGAARRIRLRRMRQAAASPPPYARLPFGQTGAPRTPRKKLPYGIIIVPQGS